jgi:hypothetical protein
MTATRRRALLGGALAAAAAAGLGPAQSADAQPNNEQLGWRDGRPRPGVEALLALSAATPVVALSEGTHHLQDCWDFLAAVMLHPGFGKVDAIAIELGNSRYQDIADDYVTGGIVRRSHLHQIWRDTTQSPLDTGDVPVVFRVLGLARAINLFTPRGRPLRVLLADPPVDWTQVRTADDLFGLMSQRNVNWANVIVNEVLAQGRRCVTIGGQAHFFRNVSADKSGVPERIEQRYPGAVSVVHTHALVAEGKAAQIEQHVAGRARPSIAAAQHTAYGRVPAADLFGPGQYPPGFLERLAGLTVADLADHVLFLGTRRVLTASVPDWEIFHEPALWAELTRRKTVIGFPGDLDLLRHEADPAMFPKG